MVLLHPLIMQVLSFKLNVGHFPHLADLVTRINYNHFYMSDTGNLRTLPSSENVASRLGKAFLGRTDWWQYDNNLCSFHSSWSTVSEVNSFPFEMVVSYGILGCSQINIQDGHQKNSNLKIDSSVSPPHILEGSTIKHLPSNSTVYLYRNGIYFCKSIVAYWWKNRVESFILWSMNKKDLSCKFGIKSEKQNLLLRTGLDWTKMLQTSISLFFC